MVDGPSGPIGDPTLRLPAPIAALLWLAALAAPAGGLAAQGAAQGATQVAAQVTAQVTARGPVAVHDLRLGVHPGRTRVVVDLGEPVAFQVQTQPDPYRVVVDLPELDWRAVRAPQATGLVRGWRHGSPSAGAGRLVLDVSGPVRVRQAFVLAPGEVAHARLVLDLESVAQTAFAAELGRPHGTRVVDPGVKAWQAQAAPVAAQPVAAQPVAAAPAAAPQAPPVQPVPVQPVPVQAGAEPGGHGPLPFPPPKSPPQVQAAALPPGPPAAAGVEPAAARVPAPPTSRPRAARGKPMVVIDAGHGGADPGAISVGGVHEKAITLQIARALRAQLLATGRYRVALTRDGDEFVRLRDRVGKARDLGADLFVSLHADSLGQADVGGMSVYTLSDKASDREAEMLAARENRADAIGGMDLAVESDEVAGILIDLAQRDTMNQSRRFANLLIQEMGKQVRLLPRPHRSAGFAVLTAPDVPSVLVELGYLSNPRDAKLLTQSEHQIRLARSIVRGIDGYFAAASGSSRS